MVYIISYDLNKQGQNYDELYKRIKDISDEHFCHMMDSAWIIKCNKSTHEIYEYLSTAIDTNDYLFIAELKNNCQGSLREEHWYYISDLFNQ